MAYIHNNNSLNLNGVAPQGYPTPGGDKTCVLGSSTAPSHSTTLKNNGSTGMMQYFKRTSSGDVLIGDRLTQGESTYNISGTLSQTNSHFYYQGNPIYYDVTKTNPNAYVQIIRNQVVSGAGTDVSGTPVLKGYTLRKWNTSVTPWKSENVWNVDAKITSEESTSNNTDVMEEDNDCQYELTHKPEFISDAHDGTEVSPAGSMNVSGDFSGSGTWKTSGDTAKSLYSTDGIIHIWFSYRNGPWTEVRAYDSTGGPVEADIKIPYDSGSYCTITEVSWTRSGYSFNGNRGSLGSYSLKWYAYIETNR